MPHYSETNGPSRLDVAVTLQALIPAAQDDVFRFVSAEDVLPKILTGYGLVPGVVSTSDVSGPWDRPGVHRVVHLADGSTVDEAVTTYDRPSYFSYRVSNPSFALKHLMTDARGEFRFVPEGADTHLTWTYTFRAKDDIRKLPLALFVRSQWRGYMDVCMRNIGTHFAGTAPTHRNA
ncbi:SRPBCC family protein [Roseicyclus sp. F158]|uniref:SRPBCC family protein n=1 Tax=Tropicimonas omnivorans TaxID=3075590 RepID=A0ABU3DKE6_9RHOB|nr:SRPBCC family protein [Roseicyclus sp. F158]MDT0684189.1 SRPBCC family protein [Roseicyclus sp. F158]